MVKRKTLLQNYQDLRSGLEKIYVVPEIPEDNETDYLYLLYRPIIQEFAKHKIQVLNLSISEYPRIVLAKIRGEKSIYHHHWYHLNELRNFFYFIWRTFWILIFRLVGGKIVWTVHNIAPHHGKYRLYNKISRRFLALIASKLHVHCDSAVDLMAKKLGVRKKKFFIVELPHYPSYEMSKEAALKELNEKYVNNSIEKNDLVFLSFGLIGKYKRIKETVEIFTQLEERKKLIIAGKVRNVEQEYLEEIKELVKDSTNIFLINQAIPNEEIPILFNSVDYLILNYKQVLTSAVLKLGLSYGRHVIAVDQGCISEEKDDKIIKFKDEFQLKEIITSL